MIRSGPRTLNTDWKPMLLPSCHPKLSFCIHSIPPGFWWRSWWNRWIALDDNLACVGDHFHVWVVSLTNGWLLALMGLLIHRGALSCGSAGTIVDWWCFLCWRTMMNNEWKFVVCCSVAHVALCFVCSMCFACVLRLSWLCGACIGGHGVWWWMVRVGDCRWCMWMMVVTWKVIGSGFEQNSHLQNLPKSFFRRVVLLL